MIRKLNVPVADESLFAELTRRRSILGLHSSRPSYVLTRETFFDTSDGALGERGMTLRVRSFADGRAVVELSVLDDVSLQGIVRETVFETPVLGGGLYATLEGTSEVSGRVREVVEPAALRPLVALDVDRETRDLKAGRFGRATHRISFDEVIAHAPGVTRTIQEVTITETGRGRVGLEELASRLRSVHGIVADGRDTLERLQGSMLRQKGAPRPEAPQDVRVALMLMCDWEIGLVDTGLAGLALPTARGTGEELAREYLAELCGEEARDAADLDLVGFSTARRGDSDLEVWLHETVGGTKTPRLVWLPLVELMERAGGPRLRRPSLVSALLMLARSETGMRLLRNAPLRRGPPRLLDAGERAPDAAPGEAPEDLLDLELSILDFNQRVLELSEDPAVPLLERLRFLSIFSSNMDEYFVVRVGRLKEEVSRGGAAGDLAAEQLLDLIAVRVRALVARQCGVLQQLLLPALAEHGTRIVAWEELKEEQKRALTERFEREIFPLLTPLSMAPGPGRQFPRLISLGLALALVLRRSQERPAELGYVAVPDDLERFLEVPDSADLIPLERVIAANAGDLFPSMAVQDAYVFRASRLSDVEIDEDNTGSLLSAVADEVEEQAFKPVIRVEVESRMPREVRAYILKGIRSEQSADAPTLTRSDLYELDGPLDLRGLAELIELPITSGRYEPFVSRPVLPADRPVFEVLSERDVLCHHPYQDFDSSVARLIEEAAHDPEVVSIKLTLYRTGRRSPIVDSLLRALEGGKEVAVFVELMARFDEESNIQWTRRLTEAGARVVYGVVGFKIHAKTALIVRREAAGVRRYVHIGTGNYNSTTARFYTDLGLMSADPDLGADLNDFFNELTGQVGPPRTRFRRLLVAPESLAPELERMIGREVEHARGGRPARIQAKLNGLADRHLVRSLYEAARAGVRIDLVVRSICTLRPGVPGLSEGIHVRSVLGRFLEHARVYYFENAGQGEYYIGSADWRARNLHRRVEVATPVDDADARAVLRDLLDRQLADPTAWVLRPDGAYERLRGEGPSSQEQLIAANGSHG